MRNSKKNDRPKIQRELWMVEFDGSLSPIIRIISKSRIDMRKVKAECEALEKDMFKEEVERALKKVYSS